MSDEGISSIVDGITKGNLHRVINDILDLEITHDVGLRLIDGFNRRLKKLNGSLLPVKEKEAAKLLLSFVTNGIAEDGRHKVFPYMLYLATIYRHMLLKEKCLMVEVGERLLIMDENWSTPENHTQDLALLRNNFYAFSWNFLRENHEGLDPEESLRIVSQGLRWLIRQGEKSFSSASHKLQQMAYIVQGCPNHASVERFVRDLLNEAKKSWLKDTKAQSWKHDPLQVDGLYNFVVCSIRYALYFDEFEIAKAMYMDIFETFKYLFDPDLSVIVEKSSRCFYDFAAFILGHEEDVEMAMEVWAEKSSSPGIRLVLWYGYVQGICCHLISLLKDPNKAWVYLDQSKESEFERIIASLFSYVQPMSSASSHSDLVHIDKKRRELESTAYVLILRLISEYINSTKSSTKSMKVFVEKCFTELHLIVSKNEISKEAVIDIYSKMNYHGGQIGTALTRLKDYKGALKILMLAIDVGDKLLAIEKVEVTKADPTQLGMVVADAYHQLQMFDKGLKFLSDMVYKYQYLMSEANQTSCVDILEPICWYNWNYQWISLKRNVAGTEWRNLMRKNVTDYLLLDKKINSSLMKNNKQLLLQILYFEFNSYFTTKGVIPDGLISVGEALQTHGVTLTDRATGLLAQAIGFWWGDMHQIMDSISLCEDALVILQKESDNGEGRTEDSLLLAMTYAWTGLSNLRKFQEKSVAELDVVRSQDMARNPKKYSGIEDDRTTGRVIPAISSIQIGDENLVATQLMRAIDILYQLLSTREESEIRKSVQRFGSAVLLATVRLLMDIVNSMGIRYHFLKICCVAKTLAKMYDRTYLFMISSNELLKMCPSAEAQLITSCQKLSLPRNPNLYLMQITLAKTKACLRSKRYQEAVKNLTEIFQNKECIDMYDVGVHILGEAYYILAELKIHEADFDLDLSDVPKYLRFLTPVGLISKGFKLLASASRSPNPIESGWNDLFHNYSLFASIMNISEFSIHYYWLCGKLREARCVAADLLYLVQQMALVSRTLEILIPLAEMDITSRNFESCHEKVDCILAMLKSSIPGKKLMTENICRVREKLGLSEKDVEWIVGGDDVTWSLNIVTLPEHNYGAFGPPPSNINDSPTIPEPRKMKRIMYLHHRLNCQCHICTHPTIIPTILRFYCLQAKLAACSGNTYDSGLILESANRFHIKSILRILNNLDDMKLDLKHFFPEICASESLDLIYRGFSIFPGINSQLTKIEMVPAKDLKESIPSYYQVISGLKLGDLDHSTYTSIPLEMLAAAVFKIAFLQNPLNIKRSSIRDLIEKENTEDTKRFSEAQSPEPRRKNAPSQLFCQPPRRKGMVKTCDSDDENHPESEKFGGGRAKVRIPFNLGDADVDVDVGDTEVNEVIDITTPENSNSVPQGHAHGPARNTRSHATAQR